VTLSGTNFDGRIPSGLQALSLGDLAPPFFGIQGSGTGAAGDIVVTTGTLTVEGGAMITSSSFGPGAGGKIQVTATESVTLTGGNLASDVPDSNFVGGNASGLFAQTGGILPGAGNGGTVTMTTPILNMNSGTIATSTSSSGNAGSITLNLGTATLTNNATITSSSTGQATGAAGTVTIQGLASPSKSVSIDGTGSGIFTNTEGTGRGGDIHLFANSVTLQNGAHVSSSSTGTGPNAGRAGDITINAGNQLRMTNSSVTTEADAASGGAIKITTNPEGTVQLTDSTISASVLDGAGGGGSVNIDPQFVILQNSQILAKAIFGPGGNISITTNLLLQDANSIISASSQFGQQGTITIQSPIDPAGGKIIPLSQKPLIATAFLSQRCAAMAGGEFSGLTVAGRDSLPAEPSSWLASPLAMTTVEFSSSSVTNTGTTMSMHEPAKEAPLLSLRQIAPPGFLTHAFAADSSAGCTS